MTGMERGQSHNSIRPRSLEGDTVRMSRSGRLVKPRMASWTGQRIVYNAHGSPMQVLGVTTGSDLSTSALNTKGIANLLGLSPPESPCQWERSAGLSAESNATRNLCDDSLTPVYFRKNLNFRRRIISSSDSEQEATGMRKKILHARKQSKRNPKETRNTKLPSKKPVPLKCAKKGSVEGDTVRMSRSGRVVKPRMASWTGQRIVYNAHGSPIQVLGVTTESDLSTSAVNTKDVASILGLSLPESPGQWERSAGPSADSNASRNLCDDSLTPVHVRKNLKFRRKIISSSDSEEEATGTRKKKLHRRNQNKRNRNQTRSAKLPSKKPVPLKCKKRKPVEDDKPIDEALSSSSLADVDSNPSFTDLESNDEEAPSIVKDEYPKRWKNEELNRLRLALSAIKPSSQSDWERVANAIGGGRTAAECHEMALKKLGWRDVIEKEAPDEGEVKECAGAVFKAKVGTLSYLVHAQRFMRRFVMGQSNHEGPIAEPFEYSSVAEMPSIAQFDPDDSLLDVLRTPGAADAPKANRREFIPRLPDNESTSLPKLSFSPNEVDFKERDRKQRYVHQMLRTKRTVGTSKANTSNANITCDFASRNNDGLALKDAITKLKVARKANRSSVEKDFVEEDSVTENDDNENDELGS